MRSNATAKPLLFVVLLCIAMSSLAQNAFYDAKKIVRWSKMNNASTVKARQADTIKALITFHESFYNVGVKPTVFLNEQKKEAENLISRQNLHRIDTADLLRDLEYVRKEDTGKINDAADKTIAREILRENRSHAEALNDLKQFKSIASDTTRDFTGVQEINSVQSILIRMNIDSLQLATIVSYGTDSVKKLVYTIQTQLQENTVRSKSIIFEKAKSLKIENFRELFNQSFQKAQIENPELVATVGELSQRVKASLFTSQPSEEITIKIEQSYQTNTAAPNLVDLNFPSQSDIIDAVAIYLAKRTKQEAVLYFLEKLEKTIARDDLAQDLFPQTWNVMQQMDYSLAPRFGAKWQNAIAADYISLPVNIRESRFIQDRVKGKDSIGFQYFVDALTFADYVGKKFNFLDIVRTLYYNPAKLKGDWTKRGIKALHIINTELKDSSQLRYNWIHPQEWLSMSVEELTCFYELLRLKYQLQSVPVLENTLRSFETERDRYNEFKSIFGELLTMLRQFNDVQHKTASKEVDGNIIASDGFWDAQRNLVDFLVNNAALLGIDAASTNALALCKSGFFIYDYLSNKNYAGAATEALSVVSKLTANKYKDIIQLSRFDAAQLEVHDVTLPQRIKSLNRRFSDLFVLKQLGAGCKAREFRNSAEWIAFLSGYYISDSATLAGLQKLNVFAIQEGVNNMYPQSLESVKNDYAVLKQELDGLLPSGGRFLFKSASKIDSADLLNAGLLLDRHNNEFYKWLTEISTLFTEVSGAQKPADLAMVLESYALPPGSYRNKRNSNFSIDLNAFTGVYAGFEWIETAGKGGLVYGITAPVGVAFSWGIRSRKKILNIADKANYFDRKGALRRRSGKSITVDLTVIDIGAAFSYRLTNASEGLPNEVRWDQVVSPALNVRIGFKNTPFVIGAGVQRTPKLRSFKDGPNTNGQTPEPFSAYRLHLTAAFDLPLINVYRAR